MSQVNPGAPSNEPREGEAENGNPSAPSKAPTPIDAVKQGEEVVKAAPTVADDTSGGLIRVWPKQVNFERAPVEADGRSIVKTFSIQNTGHTVRSVRLNRPISKHFRVVNRIPFNLAAGLRCIVKIQLLHPNDGEVSDEENESENVSDRIIVQTDVGNVTVPLLLKGKYAEVQVPPSLDFGHVVVGSAVTKILELRNAGPREGTFEVVKGTESPFKVSPSKGTVPPYSVSHVRCEASCETTGTLRSFLQFNTGDDESPQLVDVSATVVGQALELLEHDHTDEHVQQISFGHLYFGECVDVCKTLLNNSPHGCTFRIDIVDNVGAGEVGVEVVSERSSGPLSVSPREGVLEPYSQLPLSIKFRPRLAKVERGFKSQQKRGQTHQYNLQVIISATDTGQSLKADITAVALDPDVALNHKELNFGSCGVFERLDTVLKIENKSAHLDLPFSLKRLAQYSVQPDKGVIAPLQTVQVHVSFVPKQLGMFRGELQLVLGATRALRTISIPVQGVASKMGRKEPISEGIEYLPEDYKPERKYVEPRQICSPLPTDRTLLRSTVVIPENQTENHFTFSADQFRVLNQNRSKYDAYLTSCMLKRQKASGRVVEIDPTDDVSLGLLFAHGLEEPDVPLPSHREPLWLQYPMAGYPGAQVRAGDSARVVNEQTPLNSRKFKPTPSTQAEMRDCSEHLSVRRLAKVSCAPNLLDFGSVCINSTTRKTFSVVNNLRQHVRVALCIENEELIHSTPEAQVIPPSKAAGFDIVLRPTFVQDLRVLVEYIVNDQHHLNFTVTAEVTPMDLSISANDVVFGFLPDSLEFSTTRRIILHNPCGAEAEFRWDVGLDSLHFLPVSGVVPAGKDMEIQIMFRPPTPAPGSPDTDMNIDHIVKLFVTGGKTQTLHCRSKVPQSVCTLDCTKVDFGMVAVGAEATAEAVLTNTGLHAAVFKVLDIPEAVEIRMTNGRLPPGQSTLIRMRMRPSRPTTLNTAIVIAIRGGPSLSLLMSGEAVLPELSVLQDEIDFGGVTVGGHSLIEVAVRSDSRVPTALFLDLGKLPEFSLNLPPEWAGLGSAEAPIVPVSSAEVSRAVGSMAREVSGSTEGDEENEVLRAYKITIKPGTTQMLPVEFAPLSVSEYAFPLPLYVAGLPSYGKIRRVVHAEGLKPKVVLSQSLVDFGERIVLQPSRAQSSPYRIQVTITNDDLPKVEWNLDAMEEEDDEQEVGFGKGNIDLAAPAHETVDSEHVSKPGRSAAPDLWSIEPTSGVLARGECMLISVVFAPVEPGDYHKKIGLFLGDEQHEPYMELCLKGSSAHPMLKFDISEVALPVVPLGIPSSARVWVSNCGYDSLDLRYRLPQDSAALPLQIEFPSGTMLGHGRNKLPVDISFQSSRPTAFMCTIDFLDNSNHRFSLPVSACADNSLFTMWPFLLRHNFSLVTHRNRPTMIVDNGRRQHLQQSSFAIVSSDNIYPTNEVLRASGSVLRFLAALNLLEPDTNPDSFPTHLVETKGAAAIAVVEFLSGKSISKTSKNAVVRLRQKVDEKLGRDQSGAGLTSEERTTLERYNKLLTFLKANGALITSKPEYLMSLPVYMRLLSARTDEETSSASAAFERRAIEKVFPIISRQAWLEVLHQTIKMFILRRVTPKAIRSLPGLSSEGAEAISKDPTLVGSNIFSTHEAILLRWMQYHHDAVFPNRNRHIANFDSDLRDSVVLAALLIAHNPYLKSVQTLELDCGRDESLVLSNAQRLLSALEESGFAFTMEPQSIMNPNPREMLLLVLYLFETLPSFIPKARLEFRGSLHTDIAKTIELTNPARHPISYDVRIDGSSDFKVESSSITLGERGSDQAVKSFKVCFRGRFLRSTEARLLFLPRRQVSDKPPLTWPKPILFQLSSRISERSPLQTFHVRSSMYAQETAQIAIQNTFGEDCEFTISISSQGRVLPKSKRARSKQALAHSRQQQDSKRPTPSSASGGTSPTEATDSNNVLFPVAFSIEKRSVKILKGETERISVFFLPFLLGDYSCDVLLIDPNVGEMLVELKGVATTPQVADNVKFQCKERAPMVKELKISARNSQLEKARALVAERETGHAKVRAKEALKQSLLPSLVEYNVDISSPYFSGPSTLAIVNKAPEERVASLSRRVSVEGGAAPDALAPKADTAEAASTNVLRLCFQGGPAGQYPCTVVLSSPYDVRRLDIECSSLSQGSQAELEFQTAAGQAVKQRIPLVNNTDTEWYLKAELSGQGFSGDSSMVVKEHTTGYYTLQFLPLWMCKSSGKLVLSNENTKENYVYNLTGEGQEPLASDHVKISCRARERKSHLFKVSNRSSKDIKYSVQSDLAHVSGPSSLFVKAGTTAEYELVVSPQLGGTYNGSLTMLGPDNRFQWFAVEIVAASPEPERTLSIETHLRKAVAVEIHIKNPLDESVVFDVHVDGDGLFGEPSISLGPLGSQTYALLYAPLKAGKFDGSIAFVNQKVGEFWYKLALEANRPLPIELKDMECEVGCQSVRMVTLDNATDHPIVLSSSWSNPTNFSVQPSIVKIPSFESAQVQVVYTPSTIDKEQFGELRFSNGEVGEWVYHVKGVGRRPTKMPPTDVISQVCQRVSGMIHFRNPFEQSLRVRISLEDDARGTKKDPIFHLFLKRSSTSVMGLSSLQVAFFFNPPSMARYEANIVIEESAELRWVFPIVGEAEVHSSDLVRFACPARGSEQRQLDLPLAQLAVADVSDSDCYTFSLQFPDGEGKLLKRALHCCQLTKRPKDRQAPSIRFDVAFEPLRPFTEQAQLVLTKNTGGRWIFDLLFEASEPKVDDVIHIEASLNSVASVAFRLTNQFEWSAPFKAFFSPDSPYQLSVQPSEGVLEPFGTDGSQFIVSFTATEYGKPLVGRLIIQTDDMQWSYEVQGTHPHYLPPTGEHTFSSFMDSRVMGRMQQRRKKNYLKRNIRANRRRSSPSRRK